MDVFISYSRDDAAYAGRLARAIEQAGFSAWYDHKMPVGDSFNSTIEDAIDNARVILVLVTPRSAKSAWVQYEIGLAMQKGARIIPVTADEVDPGDLPSLLSRMNAMRLSDLDTDAGLSKLIDVLAPA